MTKTPPGGKSAANDGQRPFLYLAASSDGGRKVGLRRAGSEKELWLQLRRERLVPLKNWSLPGLSMGGTGMPLKDLAEINVQLAQLLSRGVPLVEALQVAASAVTAATKPRIDKIREMVASGTSFADSCRAVGGFDVVTVSVYRAAERTGDLAGAARQLAQTIRRQLAISGKAVTLLVYPAIVMTISICVSIYLLIGVVPQIGKVLEDSGTPIPTYTKVVLASGAFLRDFWAFVLLGLLVAVTFMVLFRGMLVPILDRAIRRLPLIKDVLLAQESARFFSVMAAMTRTGVTLADGLGTATGAVRDPNLKGELRTLRTRLIEGGVLRNLIEDVETLPLATRKLLIAGERAGDLQTVFENLAEDLAEEVEKRSARLLAAMQPVLTVVMFLMIGSLVVSIMVPLMNMSGGVR